MSLAQKIISRLPYKLQFLAIKLLYRKRGVKLQDFKVMNKGKFYLYKIDGTYIPSESLGWFVTYPYYQQWVDTLSAAFYKPRLGDVILDIGAGIGEEAIVFSRMVGDEGRVYCIEANPQVFGVLETVVGLNRLKNILLYNIAINNDNSEVFLEVTGETFLRETIKKNASTANKAFKVQGKKLKTFIEENDIPRINLLKVNIEGAERFVIETIGDAISKVENVAISCHDFRYKNEGGNEFFRTHQLVYDFLVSKGFIIQSLSTGEAHKDDWIFGSMRKSSV